MNKNDLERIAFKIKHKYCCYEEVSDFSTETNHILCGDGKKLEQDILDALINFRKEVLEEATKIVESGYLYGSDCKNDDYACNKCGGDIRAQCCIWQFNHKGNVFIAKAIREEIDKEMK